MHALDPVVTAWQSAAHLGAGADALLDALLEHTRASFADTPFARVTTVLRAMLQLRPEGTWRALFMRGESAAEFAPSTTAWTRLQASRAPVAVDVEHRFVGRPGDPVPVGARDADTFASHVALRQRNVTHVLALPVRGPGAQLLGMVTLEVHCAPAVGRPFPWRGVIEGAQRLVDVSAPWIALLPIEAAVAPQTDELLPVVGRAMREVISLLDVFARLDETLLIMGPTGAGKTRLAKWCHAHSDRVERPFVTVDLLTVPDQMQMAELFGWRRGAFTGAVSDQEGQVARAEGGTLFLDEIDKLSLSAQAGLLRLLEERRYQPLGDKGGDRSVNVRFVIGTNTDLAAEVAAGRFREDLYYRINVLPVQVPALAQRRDTIPDWARYMAERARKAAGRADPVSLSDDGAAALTRFGWPGNLRQLDNVVRRAWALALVDASGRNGALTIEVGHVERALRFEAGPAKGELLDLLRDAAELFVAHRLGLELADGWRGLVIEAALEQTEGDRAAACQLLGQDSWVKSRNHAKMLRKEATRLDALRAALDG